MWTWDELSSVWDQTFRCWPERLGRMKRNTTLPPPEDGMEIGCMSCLRPTRITMEGSINQNQGHSHLIPNDVAKRHITNTCTHELWFFNTIISFFISWLNLAVIYQKCDTKRMPTVRTPVPARKRLFTLSCNHKWCHWLRARRLLISDVVQGKCAMFSQLMI